MMLSRRIVQLAASGRDPPHQHHLLAFSARRNYHPKERLPLTAEQKKKYPQVEQEITDEGFPVLNLFPRRSNAYEPRKKREFRKFEKPESRELKMKEDQDWPSVWPTARTFKPSAVPLPLRQSYELKPHAVPRGKYANTELIKIANFLHLTPDAIKRHCLALRPFCTEWPRNLDTEEEVKSHFPVTIITNDYVHASPTIRDERARVVRLVVKVKDLKLNERDERKLIELARYRYNKETDELTITTDACPVRIQNEDYAQYLISALYYESKEHQSWEDEWFDHEAIYKIDLNEYRKKVEQQLGLDQ